MKTAKQQQQQHHVDDTEDCEKSTAIDPQLTMALVDESTFRLLQSFNSKEVQIRPRKKCEPRICVCSWTVGCACVRACVRVCVCVCMGRGTGEGGGGKE